MSNIDWTKTITAADRAASIQTKRRAGVTAEAQRRVAVGATFTIDGFGDVPISGALPNQINLMALAETARDLIAAGKTTITIPYRDENNTIHQMTPKQMLQLIDAGKAYVSAIYAASWALKDAELVPADYADDKHWP